MIVIRIASHRGWSNVRSALGRKLQGLWNMQYAGSYGLTEVTPEEFEKIRRIPSVTRSRQKRETLWECIPCGF